MLKHVFYKLTVIKKFGLFGHKKRQLNVVLYFIKGLDYSFIPIPSFSSLERFQLF
jgi:hypothetical protein